MYLNFYNLSREPFDTDLDLEFLWLGEKHREALAAIKYGILENKGFISLTGDKGAGKSTIVKKITNILAHDVIFAQIADPPLKKIDFFNFIATAFEMHQKFSTKVEFLANFKRFLTQAYRNKKEVVLIIEEAHRLNIELLEEIRLFSNIEKPNKKLINILFVGQKQFMDILEENKALKQLIHIGYHLEPLSDIETEQYIIHRLKIAGAGKKIFSPGAIREICSFSGGNLRLINVICDLALMSGYKNKSKIIETEIIEECAVNVTPKDEASKYAIEDQMLVLKTNPKTKTAVQPGTLKQRYQNFVNKVRNTPIRRRVVYLTSISLIILLCIFGSLYFISGYKTNSANLKTAASQLLELSNQKALLTNRLQQSQSTNADLLAELKQLNNVKARITELESMVTTQEQMLSETEKKLTALEKDLEQEKENTSTLSAELSSKDATIAEFQEKLQASQSHAIQLEDEIEISRKKIAELQNRLSISKQQTVPFESSPAIVETQKGLTSTSETFEREAEAPDPSDIIDYVLKKKSD